MIWIILFLPLVVLSVGLYLIRRYRGAIFYYLAGLIKRFREGLSPFFQQDSWRGNIFIFGAVWWILYWSFIGLLGEFGRPTLCTFDGFGHMLKSFDVSPWPDKICAIGTAPALIATAFLGRIFDDQGLILILLSYVLPMIFWGTAFLLFYELLKIFVKRMR